MRHLIHSGLFNVNMTIAKDAIVPEASMVVEARGLRADDLYKTRDVVTLDCFEDGRHLVIDAIMTTI